MKRQLLITGASGFVGWNICQLTRERHHVTGTFHKRHFNIPGVTVQQANLFNIESHAVLLDQYQPDAVIHAAAYANAHDCEKHPVDTHKLNVEMTTSLAKACYERNIDFLFISTDLIFDGQHPPYTETAPPQPVSVYGKQKAEAEQAVRTAHSNAVICRLPLLFGAAGGHGQSFLQGTLQAMREGRELTLFTDEYRTPVSIQSATEGMLLALEQKTPVLHLGGRERVNRLELGKMIADVFGFENPPIKACRQQDIQLPAPRPSDVSLDSSLAYSLGFNPLPLREELQQVAKRIRSA